MNEYIGSDFDEFLEEDGLLAESERVAIKRVITFQIEKVMDERPLTNRDGRADGDESRVVESAP